MVKEFFSLFVYFLVLILLGLFWVGIIRSSTKVKRDEIRKILNIRGPIVGFFHPEAAACGGGEKVLF